ncbi:MAG TPA: glycosyltransferase family A protein, partial [Chlamydiales bacterium]|nr:glycosyltransferase family A protein [Chlamydiales bacterium]
IPSYNNERWCIQNLESIVRQSYPHYSVIYINDCSTDKTGQMVDDFIKTRNLQKKFTVIHNKKRKGALCNLYTIISSLPPKTIVVTVDGDDELYGTQVLDRIANEYKNSAVWMTYGNYVTSPPSGPSCCGEIPKEVAENRTFRSFQWVASHLRTFYAKLFQKIKKKDLLIKGEFYPATWDQAFMLPMLEMSSKGHFRFIQDPLYIYNIQNPINDSRVRLELQLALDKHIRAKRPYPALHTLF